MVFAYYKGRKFSETNIKNASFDSDGCPEKFVPLPIDLKFFVVANAKLQIFGDLPKGLSPFL